MHNASPVTPIIAPFNYWWNCTEGVWWSCYIGSDIWFQTDLWEIIFTWFLEQLLKDLVAWGGPGWCSMIDHFLRDASWVLSYPNFWVLLCSVVPGYLKGIAPLQMAKCLVFVLMQILYPYIVWTNFPKFQKNCASCFWDMGQSMWVIVLGNTTIGGGGRTN